MTSNTLAAFEASFYDQHRRKPTSREVWDAAMRSRLGAATKAAPAVPDEVIGLVTKYGDERSGNKPEAATTLGEVVTAIRVLLVGAMGKRA